MNAFVLTLITVAVGGLVAAQPPVNARLGQLLGNPFLAALVSFTTGTTAIVLTCLARRVPLPTATAVASVPWWGWVGGLLGAVFVVSAIVITPRLGAAAFIAAIVTGQMLTSVLLDHFGLVGLPKRPVDWVRVAGAALIIGGVYLITRPAAPTEV
ncbi:MAG: DMT family transporter [Planctomycetota bacterium]